MKTEDKDQAVSLTQDIMSRWYQLDLKPVRAYIDDHVSWIGGAEGQFYLGREAVLKGLQLASSHMYPCALSGQTYQIADSGKDWCVVVGNIMVTLKTEKMFMHEPQRVTFVWRMNGKDLRISHMHVSNNWAAIGPDEDFPIKASRTMYEYLAKRISGETVTVMSSDRTIYHIECDAVLYLSAANEYVIVHDRNEDIRVHQKLSKVYQELFPSFIPIHRSYCVNPNFLRSVSQYEAVLIDGTKLPISHERYASVCRQIGITL